MVIKAPLKSQIEIPNPNEISSNLRSLGFPTDMMKKYLINITLPKTLLSAHLPGTFILRGDA